MRRLLANQGLAVLATQNAGQPHGSLVAFAASTDLRTLVFATGRATRKYAHIERDPRVALLIDNRTNSPADFENAEALTVLGDAAEADATSKAASLVLFLDKHPYLKEFAASPSCALLRVQVREYNLVQRFQQVVRLRVEP